MGWSSEDFLSVTGVPITSCQDSQSTWHGSPNVGFNVGSVTNFELAKTLVQQAGLEVVQ